MNKGQGPFNFMMQDLVNIAWNFMKAGQSDKYLITALARKAELLMGIGDGWPVGCAAVYSVGGFG